MDASPETLHFEKILANLLGKVTPAVRIHFRPFSRQFQKDAATLPRVCNRRSPTGRRPGHRARSQASQAGDLAGRDSSAWATLVICSCVAPLGAKTTHERSRGHDQKPVRWFTVGRLMARGGRQLRGLLRQVPKKKSGLLAGQFSPCEDDQRIRSFIPFVLWNERICVDVWLFRRKPTGTPRTRP